MNLAVRCLEAHVRDELPKGFLSVAECHINEDAGAVCDRIAALGPALLAMTCHIWSHGFGESLAVGLKRRLPGLVVVVGGPEIPPDPEPRIALLRRRPDADILVAGEGEIPFRDLLRLFRKGWPPPAASLAAVPSLAYRIPGDPDGACAATPCAPPLSPADWRDPYPDGFGDLAGRTPYLETSRGCPSACAFCLSSRSGGVRLLPADEAIRRIDRAFDAGLLCIKLVDRTFNADPDRARMIFRHLSDRAAAVEAGTQVPRFHFEMDGGRIDEGTLEILAGVPVGLLQFEIGVQSADPAVLRAVGRPDRIARIGEVARRLRRDGRVLYSLDLVAGLPGQDAASFRDSFDRVHGLSPHRLQVEFLKVLPGTRLEQRPDLRHDPRPPYEVRSTDWMSGEELDRIRCLEAVVERFYNGRGRSGWGGGGDEFRRTMALLQEAHPSPHDLFLDLGLAMASRIDRRRGVPFEDRYRLVLEYAASLACRPGFRLPADWFPRVRVALRDDYAAQWRPGLPPPDRIGL